MRLNPLSNLPLASVSLVLSEPTGPTSDFWNVTSDSGAIQNVFFRAGSECPLLAHTSRLCRGLSSVPRICSSTADYEHLAVICPDEVRAPSAAATCGYCVRLSRDALSFGTGFDAASACTPATAKRSIEGYCFKASLLTSLPCEKLSRRPVAAKTPIMMETT